MRSTSAAINYDIAGGTILVTSGKQAKATPGPADVATSP